MKISVIIPVYNVEKYLAQCLESTVCQTHKDLEIIIIDDGSPDDSAAIYNEYAARDGRIKIIRQENKGLSTARNAGLDAATGDYVHFMDSDDYIDLNYYERMVNAAESAPGTDILAGGVVSQNGDDYAVAYPSMLALGTAREKFRITGALKYCTIWRYVYRREFLIAKNMRFADGRIFEDMIFAPPAILAANRVVTVPDTNYYYVFNSNSILRQKNNPKRQAQYEQACRILAKFIRDNDLADVARAPETVIRYQFFGITFAKKTVRHDYGDCRYWLFGIRIPIKKSTKMVRCFN